MPESLPASPRQRTEEYAILEPADPRDYDTSLMDHFPLSPDTPPPEPEALPAPPSRLGALASALRELIETILLTFVIFFMIRFAVENFRIEGYSMEPNFHDGQFLLVNKIAYKVGRPERNDVVIFHFPLNESKNYIKRVIGLPGDKVQVKGGRVFINDVLVPETYPFELADYDYGPVQVGPNEYFVLGDNRPESSDSHFWGLVPAKDVVGKAWLSYWPPSMWGLVPDYTASASP